MGLAPGVVIRPIQVKIPKMGLPLELIAGKMQQMQGIKDAFDEMSEMTPTALKLGKGDEDLLKRYNQYVGKLSESVAGAFMSGDTDKAMKTLVAAKSQLAREWKEGGVATALKDRSVAYQQQLQEYNKREVGKDYTDMHKTVDFYEWKNSIGDIKYDIETGSYTSIGAMGKTTAVNILEEAKKYADSLGIDKTAFVQELTNRTGTARYGIGLNQQEKVAFNKIQQQVDTFLNDPLVSRELVVQQKYRNIQSGRADDPNKLIADASKIIDLKKKNYSKIAKEYEDFLNKPLKEKRLKYSSSELNLPSGVDEFTLSVEEQEYEDKIRQELQKYKDAVTEIDNTKIDAKIAFNILLDQETRQPARQLFLNQFGIKDNITNVQWFEETDDASEELKKKEKLILDSTDISTPTPTTGKEATVDYVKETKETKDIYTKSVINVISKLSDVENGYLDNGNKYPVSEFVLKSKISDLATIKEATTEEDINNKVLQQQQALGNLTAALNTISNTTTTKEQKLKFLQDEYELTPDNALLLYDDLEYNKVTYKQVVNSYNIANEKLKNVQSVGSRFIQQNKEVSIPEILQGKNQFYRFTPDNKILLMPDGYRIENIENKEQILNDLFYAYELANKGIDISKSTDKRIQNINDNLYKIVKAETGYGTRITKENISNNTVKNLIASSKFNDNVTLVNQEYIVTKPSEKIDKGLAASYNSFLDLAKDRRLVDYKTKIQDVYTVYANGNEEEISKSEVDLPSDLQINIGLDELGRAYLKHNVKFGKNKDQNGVVKLSLILPEHIAYVTKGLKEEAVEHKINAEQGIEGSYESLTGVLQNLSKLDPDFTSEIVNSYVLDNNIESEKNSKQTTLKTKNGTPNTYRTHTIINPKTIVLNSNGQQLEGNITLYKSFQGKTPIYIIGFKTLQGEEFKLPALNNKLSPTSDNVFDDYTTAVNQYLIYTFDNMVKR